MEFIMPPEILGGAIALVSALIAVILVEFLISRRTKRERHQEEIDRARSAHWELMKPRYEQAAIFAEKVNLENLEIIEDYHISERSRHEYDHTFEESINSLHKQLLDKEALNDIDQLRSVVQTIGDEELIELAEELNGVYNGLLGWIEGVNNPELDEITFTMDDTQAIESARSNTFFYYGRFSKKLDSLQNGVWIPAKQDVKE
jgi:hypothetical protein